MGTPAPSVDFEEFGADSLSFKLYAFVYDLNKAGSTSTDLRIAILDAFNEAGIAIPFRQTDVALRSMDWLREAVTEYVSGSHNGTRSGNGEPAAQQLPSHNESVSSNADLHRDRRNFPG